MKLEELTMDGLATGKSVALGRFAEGLTFVYGETLSGKTTVRKLIRDTFYRDTLREREIHGSLVVSDPTGAHWQLHREADQRLNVQALNVPSDAYATSRPFVGDDLTSQIPLSLYDTVFSVSFKQTAQNAPRLARALRDEFKLGLGSGFAGDDSAFLIQQRELDATRTQIERLQQKVEQLQQTRDQHREQFESDQHHWQQQLTSVDSEITLTQGRLSQTHNATWSDELIRVNHEIDALRLRIEAAQGELVQPTTPPAVEHLATLYLRLDEIDNQIHRWRHLQADIQNQRLRLRDEMLVWNELTLESDDHPYHQAREILVGLESKVDQAERNAQHWAQAGGARVDTEQMAKSLGQICQSMRDDVYGLCNELAHQYKHLRHKSAAAELKQLRRCYTEMGENIDRLVRRRATVIREIRELDPAGADAIIRAEVKFCQCAQHEGYLAARQRFVGPTATPPQPIRREPDLSHERARLVQLQAQARDLSVRIAGFEREVSELTSRLAELNQQRDAIVLKLNSLSHPSLVSIDAEIADLLAQIRTLQERCEQLPTRVTASPVLVQASRFLRRLTGDQLTRVFLDQFAGTVEPQWVVHDLHGVAHPMASLEQDRQDQLYLALILAAKDALQQRGIAMPTIIDDAFSRIAGERINPTLTLLNELGGANDASGTRTGLGRRLQVVLLSQHRYLADRVPGVTVLSLEEPAAQVTVEPTVRHRVQPITPQVIRYGDNEWSRHQRHDDVSIESSMPRPYPLSKYSRVDQDLNDLDLMDDSFEGDGLGLGYPIPGYVAPSNVDRHIVSYSESVDRHRADETTRFRQPAVGTFNPVSVDHVASPLNLVPAIDDNSRLDSTGLFDASQLRRFADLNLSFVQQIMNLNSTDEEFGLSADQVDRWQSQLWLMMHVPSLRPEDACVLVACGITEPAQLATSHVRQLYERLTRFLGTTQGRHTHWSNLTISAERIRDWLHALEQTRDRWQHRQRPRQPRSFSPRSYQSGSERMSRDYSDRQPRRRTRDARPTEDRYRQRQAMPVRAPRMHAESSPRSADREAISRHNRASQQVSTAQAKVAPRLQAKQDERGRSDAGRNSRVSTTGNSGPSTRSDANAADRSSRKSSSTRSKSTSKGLKFYLDLEDHIEAAPSIGPKTAERFEKIGVVTVSDFLRQTAESMATKLNYKRLNADLIRQWQHQARLVCRVPNLRGHDAQLLVACEMIEPEELATMQPQKLFEVIGPFSDSKEGLKIIRNGKKPDLAEVTDWITWAADTRSLQAA